MTTTKKTDDLIYKFKLATEKRKPVKPEEGNSKIIEQHINNGIRHHRVEHGDNKHNDHYDSHNDFYSKRR